MPDRLIEMSNGILRSIGYDYEDGTDAMLLYLATSDLAAAIPFVIELLESVVVCGNRLANAARVGTSPDDNAASAAAFRIVYPAPEQGLALRAPSSEWPVYSRLSEEHL